jgi:hypothetical protein
MLVAHSLPAGCCGTYYPEANPLMPFYAHDAQSGAPEAKAIPSASSPPMRPDHPGPSTKQGQGSFTFPPLCLCGHRRFRRF